MLALTLLLLGAGATVVSSASQPKPFYRPEDYETLFNKFIDDYGKQYRNEQEKQMRFGIFKETLKEINKKNLKSVNTVYDVTKFADLTKEEFLKYYTGFKQSDAPDNCTTSNGLEYSNAAPDSLDWRAKNKVTPAKNQMRCGSCWAFSTIANLEGVYAIKNNKLVSFSEQQLVDCDHSDNGCHGGYMSNAIKYLMQKGAETESDYSYSGKEHECKYDEQKAKAKVLGCEQFTNLNEDTLKEILYAVGPLSVAIDANDLMNYKNGILEDCSFDQANHGVALIGYGTENGTPFWILKNSWGEDWGEKGFFKVKRGVDACGLLDTLIVSAVV